MKIHELKVLRKNWDKYIDPVMWSLRKNDRDFKIGDICAFYIEEYPIRKFIFKRITGGLKAEDFTEGLQEGYVILTLKRYVE